MEEEVVEAVEPEQLEIPEVEVEKVETPEEESEEVVIDGKDYMMVGNKLFNDSGTLVGTIHNGKAEFIEA